jgi:hypothetical protein
MEGSGTPPAGVPVVAHAPVAVRFDSAGDGWFGEGWYGPEGSNRDTFRWTRARDADVRVFVAGRQPLAITLKASLAGSTFPGGALGVSWNGVSLQPLSPWSPSRVGRWLVPADRVRRGLNVLTVHVSRLVVPAGEGAGADTRPLGAAVEALTIVPAAQPRPR